MGSLSQLTYEKPMNNQWKPMNTNENQLFLKVYGRPKPAKIWKTNETSMKTNEQPLCLNVYGKPKPAKIWKTNENE